MLDWALPCGPQPQCTASRPRDLRILTHTPVEIFFFLNYLQLVTNPSVENPQSPKFLSTVLPLALVNRPVALRTSYLQQATGPLICSCYKGISASPSPSGYLLPLLRDLPVFLENSLPADLTSPGSLSLGPFSILEKI